MSSLIALKSLLLVPVSTAADLSVLSTGVRCSVTMRAVARRRRSLAVSLLLASFVLPALSWAAALAPDAHRHDAVGDAMHHAELARALLHGHAHPEGVPDHDHRLLPPSRTLHAPAAALGAPAAVGTSVLGTSTAPLCAGAACTGSPPPRSTGPPGAACLPILRI